MVFSILNITSGDSPEGYAGSTILRGGDSLQSEGGNISIAAGASLDGSGGNVLFLLKVT